ncbi:unnamed protein product [Auanema sp. JU1783]|nr:unnamed protein product [Auanema sp. JU1783]
MSTLVFLLIGTVYFVPSIQGCADLIDFCDALSPICAGSIIQYHFEQLESVAQQIENNSAIPALEESLPKVESSLPLVGTTGEGAQEAESGFEKSLPLLKESLPLIRESLPLIRESLPLIRQFVDPYYLQSEKTTCQRKSNCKTCRECPKLRESTVSFIESLCPQTCKVCNKDFSSEDAAKTLVDYYI